jgi:HKD family nuclease
MELLVQPYSHSVGDTLQHFLLDSEGYDIFYIIVAYAKNSGISRIRPFIEIFKRNGGIVKAVVGIDQCNTSYQGLQQLLELCDELFIFHNENVSRTFHPKIYAFQKNSEKGVLIVGSSNLTAGGLYSNYEASCLERFDLSTEGNREIFEEFISLFSNYSTSSNLSIRASAELLTELLENGYLSDEDTERPGSTPVSDGLTIYRKSEHIFGTESIPIPPLPRLPETPATDQLASIPSDLLAPALEVQGEQPSEETEHGELLWRKNNLPRSDAQDVDSGTNPTGVLKFTQAGWKVNERIIDQTTYFRDDVFGNSIWEQIGSNPDIFSTRVRFHVRILGEDVGQYELQIRHKPSGEAGQGNYTTYMSWGELSKFLGNRVVGRQLSLFAPRDGLQQPYFIEID